MDRNGREGSSRDVDNSRVMTTAKNSNATTIAVNANLHDIQLTSTSEHLSMKEYTGQSFPVPSDSYPVNFSCEIYIQSVPQSRIMLRFQSLYIPSKRPICDDNYLYVFDSSTPQFRAMVEAGGEKGLCQRQFPEEPIFTTKSFMTIVFRSTTASAMETGKEPGFKLILTATKAALPGANCEVDYFLCGRRPPIKVAKNYLDEYHPFSSGEPSNQNSARVQESNTSRMNALSEMNHSERRFGTYVMHATRIESVDSTQTGYCIPRSLQCDGVLHCHNARDELPSLRIEPSHIPVHLLRDLVGAHLIPTDLNNVGCVAYQTSERSAQADQKMKRSGQRRLGYHALRRKNESHDQAWAQITSPESTILIVGCASVVVFFGLILVCSYYQCFDQHRFRGQNFLLAKRVGPNTSLILHSGSSDHKICPKWEYGNSNVRKQTIYQHYRLSALAQPNQSAGYSVRYKELPSCRVVRSLTRSTLNTTLESYQSSVAKEHGLSVVREYNPPETQLPGNLYQANFHNHSENVFPKEMEATVEMQPGQSALDANAWIMMTNQPIESIENHEGCHPLEIQLMKIPTPYGIFCEPGCETETHSIANCHELEPPHSEIRQNLTFEERCNARTDQICDLSKYRAGSVCNQMHSDGQSVFPIPRDSVKQKPPPPPPPYPTRLKLRGSYRDKMNRSVIHQPPGISDPRNHTVFDRSRARSNRHKHGANLCSNLTDYVERKQTCSDQFQSNEINEARGRVIQSRDELEERNPQPSDSKLHVTFATNPRANEMWRNSRKIRECAKIKKTTMNRHRHLHTTSLKREVSCNDGHTMHTSRRKSCKSCSCQARDPYTGEQNYHIERSIPINKSAANYNKRTIEQNGSRTTIISTNLNVRGSYTSDDQLENLSSGNKLPSIVGKSPSEMELPTLAGST